ncbi:hypothetical protein AVHY2522_10910 [Acidovorax sp. SUPP2522]|uniref:hypothetical protein n=1 Tax=unclassified Acidovorax TaxID=2684926 RepID=UPI002349AF99|nr:MULTISPECIES: hypothetical protein [unclassified Acidovorax]WCM99387.1 hypothetical protein M5C96_08225 [Acidovorax sp. GBBC 1281]GKT16227.1 hypothetical protein AVHY2522_10910 [Acidovorax sp. SUPP2522]
MAVTDTDLNERIARTTACFLRAAADRAMFITADSRVNEADAGELIGYAPGSLRNMRSAGGGPAYFNRPLGGYSKSYRLEDLAAWVERSREETL